MIGKVVSHYKILNLLGGGGMGVVYKAQDLKLGRPVALKFLPPNLTRDPEAKQRFIQEANAASTLQHGNICVVHDIDETDDGRMFISMEYLEGETLKKKIERGPLKIDEAMDIALQIAQGLASAHGHGIVHRDIKPANLLVTTDGVVKIVDFGLAKLLGQAMLTRTGSTLGTAAYMSPEQVRGGVLDNRADLWALGVVLYEMVTGHLPFRGEHELALSYSIVNEEPVPIDKVREQVPEHLWHVIAKCLEKGMGKRYQTAEEVIDDLRRVSKPKEPQIGPGKKLARWRLPVGVIVIAAVAGAAYLFLWHVSPTQREKSVAVLPFVDMSPGRDQEYFCDGMTEEIINRLSNLKELKVPARTSVFALKGTSLDVREIGKKLGVEAVLEGSVRKSGRQLRITAQLINAADAFHLWSQTYDREMEDVFSIQSDVAQQIALALDAALSPAERERLDRKSTGNLDAYNLYLQGRFYWRKRTPDDLRKAIRYFSDAVRLDSSYALAYVGLADSYVLFPFYGVQGVLTKEAFKLAEEAAKNALALDPALAEAHASLAIVWKDGYWNWDAAEREFKRSLELNPGYATARQWYSENLMIQGRQTEALEEARRAFDLEPSSVMISNNLGLQYLMNRQYDQAIASFKKTIELDPTHTSPHGNLASAYFMTSAFQEAANEARFASMPPKAVDLILSAWLDRTKREVVIRLIDSIAEKSPQMSPATLVRIYASLNDRDRTFKLLQRSVSSRDPELLYVIRHPVLDRFLPDPRYTAILRAMGLTPK